MVNRAQTTYAHYEDDGFTVVTCRISGDRLLSKFVISGGDHAHSLTHGHWPEMIVSSEIYFIAIWFSDTKERTEWAGRNREYGYRNRMVDRPVSHGVVY